MRAILGEQNNSTFKGLERSINELKSSLWVCFFFFWCGGGEDYLIILLTLSSEANFFIITIHINKKIYQKNEPKIQKGLLQNSNSTYSFPTLPP